jgi:hypothetical protein
MRAEEETLNYGVILPEQYSLAKYRGEEQDFRGKISSIQLDQDRGNQALRTIVYQEQRINAVKIKKAIKS